MRCPECGKENPDQSRYCFCGYDLLAPPTPPPQGVGGWLLFFCIQVTILGPLLSIACVALLTVSLADGAGATPVGRYLLILASLGVAVAAFGTFAGVRLWLVRPGALRVTRAYLIMLGALQVLTLVMTRMLGPPGEVAHALVPNQIMGGIGGLAGAVFWWLYFSHSKRVKATYTATGAGT